jgi:hypothetical protein
MRGAKKEIAGANVGDLVLYPVTAGARGDEIEFVALMRNLRSVRGSGGESYLQIAVNEHLR